MPRFAWIQCQQPARKLRTRRNPAPPHCLRWTNHHLPQSLQKVTVLVGSKKGLLQFWHITQPKSNSYWSLPAGYTKKGNAWSASCALNATITLLPARKPKLGSVRKALRQQRFMLPLMRSDGTISGVRAGLHTHPSQQQGFITLLVQIPIQEVGGMTRGQRGSSQAGSTARLRVSHLATVAARKSCQATWPGITRDGPKIFWNWVNTVRLQAGSMGLSPDTFQSHFSDQMRTRGVEAAGVRALASLTLVLSWFRKQSDSCQPILTISLDMSGRIWTLSLDLTSTSMNLLAHVDSRLLGSMPKKVAQVVCFASSFAVSSLHLLRFCFEVHAVVQQLFGRTNELPGNQFEGRWGELIPTFPWDRLKGLRVHRLFHPPSRRSTFARMKPIVRRIASVGIVHHNWSIALEQQCKPSIIEQKLYYLQYVTVTASMCKICKARERLRIVTGPAASHVDIPVRHLVLPHLEQWCWADHKMRPQKGCCHWCNVEHVPQAQRRLPTTTLRWMEGGARTIHIAFASVILVGATLNRMSGTENHAQTKQWQARDRGPRQIWSGTVKHTSTYQYFLQRGTHQIVGITMMLWCFCECLTDALPMFVSAKNLPIF